jgi:branched-chain amino acid transport system substrate-binding protein
MQNVKIWAIASTLGLLTFGPSQAADPGITATEIKVGNTMPYSGPASALSVAGKAISAYFEMINQSGGIGGRKINFVSLDDGYNPSKAVEQTRKLVESEEVAVVFSSLGTPTNTAVRKYLNNAKIPQLFIASGADKWASPVEFPWTIGWAPSYRIEARIYATYLLRTKPTAKVAIIYQNDDFGKDYLIGLRDGLKEKFDQMIVAKASYETSDPSVDSQVVTLKASGADVLITAATPKFATQIIRKVSDLNWKPTHLLSYVSASIGSVLQPAGLEKSEGIITANYLKDPSDPRWDKDPGMNAYREFVAKHMSGANVLDRDIMNGYGAAYTFEAALRAAGSDLSRKSIMAAATNLRGLEVPVLLPGIKLSTSQTNYRPIRQMQLQSFDGKGWRLFGELIDGDTD